ncbi:hypothetical protein KPL71_007847 [Citrus sinensis]|uniref:Uncharacterized protein n=1 Tax=Citrus sinensis TaxID=2711 RepID=A0ACB8M2Y3_CITSI|nr:hypothetical protein KPL71_007847 [Citrus sinensis]
MLLFPPRHESPQPNGTSRTGGNMSRSETNTDQSHIPSWHRRVYAGKTTGVSDLFLVNAGLVRKRRVIPTPVVRAAVDIINVGERLWSVQGRADFRINILAPSVGSWIKSYHRIRNYRRNSERLDMDVTRKDALREDNEAGETITLREIANEARERVMQDRLERMERQMETLTTVLYELRDERRRDCETPVGRDVVGAEPSLRRRRVEEIPPLADQPNGVHPHRSTSRVPGERVDEGRDQLLPGRVLEVNSRGASADEEELRQRLHNAELERDQIAAQNGQRCRKFFRRKPSDAQVSYRLIAPGRGDLLELIAPGRGGLLHFIASGRCDLLKLIAPGRGDLLHLIAPGRCDLLKLIAPGRGDLLKLIPHGHLLKLTPPGQGDLFNLIVLGRAAGRSPRIFSDYEQNIHEHIIFKLTINKHLKLQRMVRGAGSFSGVNPPTLKSVIGLYSWLSPGRGDLLKLIPPGRGDLVKLIAHGRGDLLELIAPGRGDLLELIAPGRGGLLHLIASGRCDLLKLIAPGRGDLLHLIAPGRCDLLKLIAPGRGDLLKLIPHGHLLKLTPPGQGDLLNLIVLGRGDLLKLIPPSQGDLLNHLLTFTWRRSWSLYLIPQTAVA